MPKNNIPNSKGIRKYSPLKNRDSSLEHETNSPHAHSENWVDIPILSFQLGFWNIMDYNNQHDEEEHLFRLDMENHCMTFDVYYRHKRYQLLLLLNDVQVMRLMMNEEGKEGKDSCLVVIRSFILPCCYKLSETDEEQWVKSSGDIEFFTQLPRSNCYEIAVYLKKSEITDKIIQYLKRRNVRLIIDNEELDKRYFYTREDYPMTLQIIPIISPNEFSKIPEYDLCIDSTISKSNILYTVYSNFYGLISS